MVMTGLHVEQFRCGDNLAYLLYGKKEALAIDGVAWEEMLRFLDDHGLSLTYVTNTHGHFDHTAGNEPLLRHSRALYLDHNEFPDGGAIEIEGESIRVYRTPGHTADSVCFHAGGVLITGDTLFNGTVGNCFSGDLRAFFRSIKCLMALPGETLIYAGHDYIRDSVALAKQLEPDNQDIDRFRQAYDAGHVYSTLAEELKINPYLRFNAPAIIALLKEHDLPYATEEERWLSLMSME
jgi:hydroxyacylglutathione hydrolase